jgi:hypothetical protein
VFQLKRAQDELTAAVQDELTARQAVSQALTDQANAVSQFQRQQEAARIAVRGDARTLGTDTPASLRERAATLAQLRAIVKDTTNDLASRNEAQRQINALTKEETRERQRAGEAARDALADALAIVRQARAELQTDPFAELVEKQRKALLEGLDLLPAPVAPGIEANFDKSAQAVGDLNDQLTIAAAKADAFFRHAAFGNAGLAAAVQDVTRGLDQIIGASRNIGLIGDEAARAIGDVLNLADAIGSVIEKSSAGNITGLVGAGLGVIGGIGRSLGLGQSQQEADHDRIVQANTEAIARNTAARENAFRGVSGEVELARIIQETFALRGERVAEGGTTGSFIEQLAAAGVSLGELQRVAAEHGIEVLNSKGKIVGDALDQLRLDLIAAAEAALEFSNTASAELARLENEDKLGIGGRSQDEAVAELERIRQVELDHLKLSDAEEERIRRLDLSTAQGRAAFLEFERDIARRALAHHLTKEELGFANVDELFQILGQGADAVDAFNKAIREATASFNLPSGFQAARLAAQAAIPGGPFVPPPLLHPEPFTPPMPPGFSVRGTDGAALPVSQSSVHIAAGAIVVNAAPGQSPESVAAAVIQALRDKAMAQSGDTLQFPFN